MTAFGESATYSRTNVDGAEFKVLTGDIEVSDEAKVLCDDYDTAYAALEKYTDIVGREDMRKFNSDTKYIEERYEHELSALRQSKLLWIVVSCFCIAILVVSITLLVMRDRLFETIVGAVKSQLRRIHDDESTGTRSSVLYLTVLNETKTMVLQARNLLKSQSYFLEHKQ